MAVSKIADRANVNDNAATTTVDLVLASLTVDNFLIIRTAADNSGAAGAAQTVTLSNQSGTPVDVAGVQQWQRNADPGPVSAGSTLNLLLVKITDTSGTVRLTYSGSVVQAAQAEEWSGINGATPVREAINGGTGASTTPLCATATANPIGDLIYMVLAAEAPAGDSYTEDSDTTGGSWVTLTHRGTTNGTQTANQKVSGAYKILTTSSAQSWQPTITSRDWATQGLALAAASVHSATLAAPLGGLVGAMAATPSAPAVEAVLAAPLGSLTASATATPDHPATLAAPLGGLSSPATAVVEHPAGLAAPLGSLTADSSALVEHPATLAAPLGSLTATASAVVEQVATLAAPLGVLVGLMVAEPSTPAVDAVLHADLGSLAASATATPDHPAVLDAPLGALTAVASSTVEHPATLEATLGTLTATLAADVEPPAPGQVEATLTAPLGALTSSLSADLTHPATAVAALGQLNAAITAAVEHQAVASAPLGSLTAVLSAVIVQAAALDVVLGSLAASMSAESGPTIDPGRVLVRPLGTRRTATLETRYAAALRTRRSASLQDPRYSATTLRSRTTAAVREAS